LPVFVFIVFKAVFIFLGCDLGAKVSTKSVVKMEMSIRNLRNTAFAKLFDDFVMKYGFADHWLRAILFMKSADLNAFEEAGFANFQR